MRLPRRDQLLFTLAITSTATTHSDLGPQNLSSASMTDLCYGCDQQVSNPADSPDKHEHPPPTDQLKQPLEQHLVNDIPQKPSMPSTDIATHALANLNSPQQPMAHTYHQPIRSITIKRRDDSIPVNNPETAKDLVVDDQVDYANDESLYLQHDDSEGNSAHVETKNVDSGHVNTFNVNTIVKCQPGFT
ncbi:hypothetical protein DSO57_1024951 [Entomophthora muscae]|uniref:Uncharacterized protein n=1 Tax=Entomophthora muscae TaxID=34485 RepID=A0ACC2RH66_9FUNG|nr:hypothetical protein DSO57_1024951 [Entomophthora muscae]